MVAYFESLKFVVVFAFAVCDRVHGVETIFHR